MSVAGSTTPPPDPEEIAALFDRLEPLDAAARAAILEQEFSCRPDLRREVEDLLNALPEGQAMFGKPPAGAARMFDSLQTFLLQGRQLGPFLIDSPLSERGMGLVVRARDTRNDEVVALKLLAPELAGDPKWQRRFTREAAALRALDHPGIVKLLDTGHDGGFSYFTMELIDGENLRERMGHAKPSFNESLDWTRAIADSLAAAHGAGFLHGDLKPENIMIDATGRIRLLDFGLTRTLAPNPAATQTTSAATGTVNYLSPERVAGLEPDARSDLFSVGVLLYEFLAGKTPFARSNPLATAAAILHEAPSPLAPETPAGIADLVHRCLQKDPARRPASAAAIVRILDQARLRPGRIHWPVRRLAAGAPAAAAITLATGLWWMYARSGLVRVAVPGATDIWLSGQPSGVKLKGKFEEDATPANSPVSVPVVPGDVLTFSAKGSVSVDTHCFGGTPDGGCYEDESSFGAGPENGISAYLGPASALIGVFFQAGTRLPPPDPIDFRGSRNFLSLSPQLNQIFFIGDGKTGTGKGEMQRFIVPPGATHLFLAASDSAGSSTGNLGQFTVVIQNLGTSK